MTSGVRGDEMRPITALFADIVGSTGLGERLGADEIKVLIGECVTRMSRAVEEFGGTIQAFMGDGICAYFGVPAAHEDDPERAARAALRIIGVAAEYGAEVEDAWGITGFNVRVGVNSGPAAVGVVGGADSQTVALGDTTNVAARLQSSAEPGTIAVGAGTAARLAETYVLEPLGAVSVKGRGEPVATWRLVGPRPASEPRLGTPLVGRDREIARLSESVVDLEAGRGHALVIVGDAGLGKTRMLSELRARVGEPATWLDARCASYGADVPYAPFVDVLRTWLGVSEGDAELAVRTKLRARAGALLGSSADLVLPYLGLILSVRLDPDLERELLVLSADELAERIRRAFVAWLETLAAERPVVVAVDDLQWADHPTRQLAEEVLALTDRTAVLFATTLRPDPGTEAWAFRVRAQSEFAHRLVELTLPPLDAAAARELMNAIVPAGILGAPVVEEVVARAEGNPLYLEELVRALLEAGGAGDRRRTWTVAPGSTENLPPALEALLVARIDRLGPGPRRLAQVAAVVGREFPVSVATALAGSTDPSGDLAALLRADVVREVRRFPRLECAFRHGLLQEAALSTLTPSTMRELYGRIGELVESEAADALDEHAERLAFYYYRSDDRAKALAFLRRAADRAVSLEALARADELLARARKVAERMGDADAVLELDARRAEVRARTGGGGHPDL